MLYALCIFPRESALSELNTNKKYILKQDKRRRFNENYLQIIRQCLDSHPDMDHVLIYETWYFNTCIRKLV